MLVNTAGITTIDVVRSSASSALTDHLTTASTRRTRRGIRVLLMMRPCNSSGGTAAPQFALAAARGRGAATWLPLLLLLLGLLMHPAIALSGRCGCDASCDGLLQRVPLADVPDR